MDQQQVSSAPQLFFVNVECEVRKETRMLPAQEAADKPYRTFVYVVVANSEREALNSIDSMASENWYEIKRYVQGEGREVGDAVFFGHSDHDRKRYPQRDRQAA